jgi:hypothetical protein
MHADRAEASFENVRSAVVKTSWYACSAADSNCRIASSNKDAETTPALFGTRLTARECKASTSLEYDFVGVMSLRHRI